MDCDEENITCCPNLSLSSFLVVPTKPRTLPLRCKRRLTFDDTSLFRKRSRVDDELGLSKTIATRKGSSECRRLVSNLDTGTTLPFTCIDFALPPLARTDKWKQTEESHLLTHDSGNMKKDQDEPKVQPNIGSANVHIESGDRDEKMMAKEERMKISTVVGPSTPLPPMRKHAKAVTKIQKTNLEEVSELAANSPYYTRSVSEKVLNAIKSVESQVVSCRSGGRQLKMRNKRVSQKGKKRPSLKTIRDASKAWQQLMKKAIAGSCGTMLEEDESISVELSLIFHEKVKSFIYKVGTIQGQRVYFPWKGSVLDSVVGALLTQRVSDNFSSSAFMALGVIFPQNRDCDTYSRHHRMLREQRSKGVSSSPNQDKKGNETKLRAKSAKKIYEKKKENSRKGNLKPDWNTLRTEYSGNVRRERSFDAVDYVDWYAVSRADVKDVSNAILLRGMNKKLARRIKDFLDRLMTDHGNLDLEWVRNVPPPRAKEFLLSIYGLGLKSVQCVQLLTLKQPAFPVDVNVARVTVRLGWVPVPTNTSDKLLMSLLEESSKLHDLINRYLWPRLSKLDQSTLYELHYQMITFGKVFCTKKKPSCAECPMKKDCKSYAEIDIEDSCGWGRLITQKMLRKAKGELLKSKFKRQKDLENKGHEHFHLESCVEAPKTPLKDQSLLRLKGQREMNTQFSSSTGRLPKKIRTRTQHLVYELPDWHPILEKFDDRDPDDSSPYLLVIWELGDPLAKIMLSSGLSCTNLSQMVPGTVMIPYRTALRGNFPLNGTHFQTNEVFADQQTSQMPIDVRCKTLQQLQRKTLYCGSDLSKIVKGLSATEVKSLFNEGYICTRGFDRKTSASVALERLLHISSQTSKGNQ